MKENILKEKTLLFALKIVEEYKNISSNSKEFVLSKQLLRSGTAIGALVREAEHAESKADFIHKLNIALKESNETEYWLELLFKSKFINENKFNELNNNNVELLRLLISIVKSTKRNLNKL